MPRAKKQPSRPRAYMSAPVPNVDSRDLSVPTKRLIAHLPLGLEIGEPAGKTKAGDVYERLRADILSCRLVPGLRLRLEEMRKAYTIGLSPLREALIRLAGNGLVILEEHKGFRVSPLSRTELLDLTSTRCDIESVAIGRALEKGDAEWEAQLVATFHLLVKQSRQVERTGIDQRWEERHQAFHHALLAGCDSPWLLAIRALLSAQTDRYRRLWFKLGKTTRDVTAEHRDLFDAAIKRDVPAASYLIRRHISLTTEIILNGASKLSNDASGLVFTPEQIAEWTHNKRPGAL
jgi:GntR family transcriptional regulator, carbon starvation induced regulator